MKIVIFYFIICFIVGLGISFDYICIVVVIVMYFN